MVLRIKSYTIMKWTQMSLYITGYTLAASVV
jgi:hypothetical protein